MLGSAQAELSRLPWRARSAALCASVLGALDSLAREHELLVLEGAGSPAEINLADCDLANVAIARHANARVLLVADIDRGGAFAHLYGTWRLLERARPPPDRRLDPQPLPRRARAAGPGAAAPERAHRRADARRRAAAQPRPARGGRRRARTASGARLRARGGAALPDSFQPRRARACSSRSRTVDVGAPRPIGDRVGRPGGAARIQARQRRPGVGARARSRRTRSRDASPRGGRVLAICGGMQIAGRSLRDDGAGERDARGPRSAGARDDLRDRASGSSRVRRALRRAARAVGARSRVCPRAAMRSATGRSRARWRARCSTALPDGLGFVERAVLGVYPHGLLEDPAIVHALLGHDAASERRAGDRRADRCGHGAPRPRPHQRAGGRRDELSTQTTPPRAPRAAPTVHARSLARARQHRRRQGQVDRRVRRGHARGRARVARQRDPVHQVGQVEGRRGEDRSASSASTGPRPATGSPGSATTYERSRARACAAWELAAATLAAGEHQLVVLDEITYPLNWGWIDDRGGRSARSASGPSTST